MLVMSKIFSFGAQVTFECKGPGLGHLTFRLPVFRLPVFA